MVAKSTCQICEGTGIDDRLVNFRACNYCRDGQLLRLNHLRIKASEMQLDICSIENEIKHLEKTIPVIEE